MRLDLETSAELETGYAVGGAENLLNFPGVSASADYSQKLQAGVKAAREGYRGAARALLLEVAAAEPDNEDAWLHLASLSEYPEELLVFLKNVLRINPSNEEARERVEATEAMLARNLVERGANASTANQTDFANQCFRQAIALDEANEAAWLGLAEISDDAAQRNELLEKVLLINPANEKALAALVEANAQALEWLLSKASAEAFAGDYDAAEDTLGEVFARSGADEIEDAWLLKAFLSPSFDDKADCWETVLSINPENELARAGTAFMRALKLRLISPLEKQMQAEFLAESAGERETEFFADDEEEDDEPTTANDAVEAANFFPGHSIAEPDGAGGETESVDEKVYEISIDDLNFSPYSTEIDGGDYFSESDASATAENQAAENQSGEPANFSNEETEFSDDEDGDPNVVLGEQYDMNDTSCCPFCSRANDKQAFVCLSCQAVLTLSDLEMLLAHTDANREIVRQAVERMEADAESIGDFGADALLALGVGLINLKDYRHGFSYLRRAAQANPNDVVLSSQINALAIRLAEIEEQASIHSSTAKSKTILVVDDSATVRKLIAGKLEKSGHAVLCAVDGMDAMEKIEENVPDLILLDITMPRMDGYTVCKMIRTNEKTRDIPVVMISGKDGFFDKVRGRMAGTTGYITKPFGPETLMKTVESYIV